MKQVISRSMNCQGLCYAVSPASCYCFLEGQHILDSILYSSYP